MVTQPRPDESVQLRLLDQAPGFILITRGPGHIVTFVNEAHRLAFNSGDWVGRTIRDAVPNLDIERLDRVFHTGETFKAQDMAAHHGVTRYLTFVCAPLRDDDGRIEGVFCEGIDVTEAHVRQARFREELEAAVAKRTAEVEQSEKTIRTIFETSYMNQGLLTTDGKIVYVNATSLASIKSRLEDVVGKDFADTPWFTGTPGMPEQVRLGIARVAAGESIQISMPLNMPTGRRIYEFSMRPAMDEAGRVVALVPEAVEITARVRAEEALQQAVKMEALGNLTGGIAHDFNNLLMVIFSSLELLRKRLPNEGVVRRLIDSAMEGAARGRTLTARLLAFARKQELRPERVDIGALVNGMVDLLRRSLGPSVSLEIEVDAPGLLAEVDPNQIESGLLNLVVNARDAMPAGGTIRIVTRSIVADAARPELKPGNYICLSVTDSGEGMDEETLKQASEPFFTTKGVGKGTGLGLSMVHGMAEQSGGALILKSAVGIGTTAEIFLPAADPTTATEPSVTVTQTPTEPGTDKVLTILIVDDDRLVLMNTADMLEDLGHTVVAATSGMQALDHLKTMTFDLMVTDHAMPLMTGAELVAQVRGRFPRMEVMIASGFPEAAIGASPDVIRLAKPFSQADLARAIERVMRG